MAKLTALIILLIAAAAFSSASAYTTGKRCEMEMERKMPMEQCMKYMKSRTMSPYNRRSFEEDHLRKCCNELGRFSSGCRCDAVSEMMMGMPQYGQMKKMEQMACQLPRMCGMDDCGCSAYSA